MLGKHGCVIWASTPENLSLGVCEQQRCRPDLRSLISTFDILLLERIISKLATSKISQF